MNTRKRNSKETNNDVEFAKPILKNSSGFLYTKNVDDDMIESNIQSNTIPKYNSLLGRKQVYEMQGTTKVPLKKSKVEERCDDLEEQRKQMLVNKIEKAKKERVNQKNQIVQEDHQSQTIKIMKHKKKFNKSIIPKIQINEKYQKDANEILNKKPIRQRLDLSFLARQEKLPLPYQLQYFLRKMAAVDRTIQYLLNYRNEKAIFFETLRKNLIESSKLFVQLSDIQSYLFLDENCYNIRWQRNEKSKRYQIKIHLPQIKSEEERTLSMRNKLVAYLIEQQAEFLSKKNLTNKNTPQGCWHQLFDPKSVEIPKKSLPIHPQQQSIDLRAIENEKIEKVENPYLKVFLKNKKEEEMQKGLSAAEVSKMIREGVDPNQITEKLFAHIRQRQKKLKENIQIKKVQEKKVNQAILNRVLNEINFLYLELKVGCMMKSNVLSELKKRIHKESESYLERCLQLLIKDHDVGYLKQLQNRGVKLIQMAKSKFKDMLAKIKTIEQFPDTL